MYQGALALYHLNPGLSHLILALEALEDVNYKVEVLEISRCDTILEVLGDLEQDLDLESATMELDDENIGDLFAGMKQILERRVEDKDKVKTRLAC